MGRLQEAEYEVKTDGDANRESDMAVSEIAGGFELRASMHLYIS